MLWKWIDKNVHQGGWQWVGQYSGPILSIYYNFWDIL